MAIRCYLQVTALALLILLIIGFPSFASSDNLTIGRMKITLMPEYDSQAVIVIQEGKFADRTAFPRSVHFVLPSEVTKLTDVCSLSPGGHHFCQLFDLDHRADGAHMNAKLPYSDFFIDYQYAPFTVKKDSQREFVYTVDSRYDVNLLEVHIQQPHRVDKFTISPTGPERYEKEGFDYYKYRLTNLKAGDKKEFSISYFKTDVNPSVDSKYSAMISPEIFEGRTGEILLIVGVLALGGLWMFRRFTANAKEAL